MHILPGCGLRQSVCSALQTRPLDVDHPPSEINTPRLYGRASLDQWIPAIPRAYKTLLSDSIRVLDIHSERMEIDLSKKPNVSAAQSPADDGSDSTEAYAPWPVSLPALEVLTIEVPARDRYTLVDWKHLRLVVSSCRDAKPPFSRGRIRRALDKAECPDKLMASSRRRHRWSTGLITVHCH